MSLSTLPLQIRPPQTALDMVVGGTLATKTILVILALLSFASWWLIFRKWQQFQEVRREGDRFLEYMEQAQRLEDAYKSILALPESPYGPLAVIGSVSPLLGLAGTVLGIMDVFLGITAAGSSNIAAVAPGVAAALITTVAGLAVAIPAVWAYNHFVTRLNRVSSELEGFSSEFIGTLAREGRV